MSQVKGLVKILQIKIANITSQKAQLDDYVHKMISKARETLQTEEQDVNTLRDINFNLDTVWSNLVDITTHLEDVSSATTAETTDQLSTTTSSTSSSLSSPLPQFAPTVLPTKSLDFESEKFSELCQRIQVLEMALTTCHNETSQANSDMNEVRDKMDKLENHIQRVETSHSNRLDQEEERLTSLEKLTQQTQSNMAKEIKDLQKSFKDNMKRTKQELDTKMNSIDDEFQKTQEQNMATIKEQASNLGKVENKLTKMKEEEQERWTQIHSIHKDVQTLKDDQRVNQQLVKIEGLEKHMETLTSQCDSLQDRVGKIEPVMQMSQELSHKISTLATDEQVQELIQTTTATSRSLEELTSKVEVTERSVRGCVAQRARDENRRREMEDRVAVVEAQRQKDLDHYTKELKETNSLYKAVCQLVDQRVTPLRRLQRMLNDKHKQVEKREEISTRLNDVVKQVNQNSTKLKNLERSAVPARVESAVPARVESALLARVESAVLARAESAVLARVESAVRARVESAVPARVGFTAYYLGGPIPRTGYRITDFKRVLCNEGDHYNASSGEFVCPVDGLYVVSTTLRQNRDGVVSVEIKRQSSSTATSSKEICRARTNLDKTSCCGVAVVRLTRGDRVYVDVYWKSDHPELTEYSSFSCFQIG